jgi:4-amino-4-deoxy-L-arabinose transferase-like glycosyltransferase
LSAAVILAAIAILVFATLGESGVLVIIWLVSILALLISQMEGKRISRPRILPQERIFLVALMGLLLITLITRVYRLITLPYNFDGDYASVGLEARALITGQRPIFAYGWAAIPMLGYLPAGLTLAVFGDNLVGLNASGVVEGLLIIVGVYLLGRDLFQARVGLIAAALLTISYAHLAASRQSVYFDPVVFLVFAIYYLLVGLREGRGWAIVVSGLLTAFCALVYFPSRIVVFIVGFMLIYLWLFRRDWLRVHWWAILLWVLAVVVTLGPMMVVFVRDTSAFMSRTREVFILNPEVLRHARSVYQVEAIPDILLEQARRSLLLFHYYPDTGTQFGFRRPLLDPFTAPLFTLGIGYALFSWRRFGAALALVWIVLGVLTGCFLTVNPPFWARLMILLPPAVLLAALALDTIYELVKSSLERIEKRAALIAPAAMILMIMVVGIWNWNTYVQLKGTYATARTRIARYLDEQPDSARAYLISKDFNYRDREFEFLVPGKLVASLTPEQLKPEIESVGTPTLLIVTPEQEPQVQGLRQLFPDGTTETHLGNSPNEIAFYVFRLP